MTSPSDSPIHVLTREIVAIGGPLASLVSHMQQHAARRGQDLSAPNSVLIDLVRPTIEDIADEWPEDRILDAAAVLRAACDRVCHGIFIVTPSSRRLSRTTRRPRKRAS